MMVNECFTLSKNEFNTKIDLFDRLMIKAEEVEGKDYQDLNIFLTEHHYILKLAKFFNTDAQENDYKAYQGLLEYIECLDPRLQGDGHLTAREFHYRKKLFDALSIGKDDAVGKDFDQLISILKEKDSVFKDYADNCLGRNVQMLPNPKDMPSMQLFSYISPLKEKKNLINKDKQALAQKLIQRKNVLSDKKQKTTFFLRLCAIVTIGCYFSWWILAFELVTSIITSFLLGHYINKYIKKEISLDKLKSKMSYIALGNHLLITFPLAAFSVYLITKDFIDNGLNTDVATAAALLLLAIFTYVLAHVLFKGCKIYAENHIEDLRIEDPENKVHKETDLLNWYDPRKFLMLFIMPLVEKCFADLESEFAERNFDEMDTNVHDTKTEQQFKDIQEPVAMCY